MPLVLKRKVNETVVVRDRKKLTVTVVETGPGWCRLMFDGPRSIDIARAEVWSDVPDDDDGSDGDDA